MTSSALIPTQECPCGATLRLEGKRVGDSLSCPSCHSLQVVLRSKAKGTLPPPLSSISLNEGEREEVAQVLRKIKEQRVGQAARHLKLYPTWAVFLVGVQPYLSGILAGENLIAMGQERRGRRLQILGSIAYLLAGGLALGGAFFASAQLPPALAPAFMIVVSLACAAYFSSAQHGPCEAARMAGAESSPLLIPFLLGLILLIAQAFALNFLRLSFLETL